MLFLYHHTELVSLWQNRLVCLDSHLPPLCGRAVALNLCEKTVIKNCAPKSNWAGRGDIMSLPYCCVKMCRDLTALCFELRQAWSLMNDGRSDSLKQAVRPPWEIKQGANWESKVRPPHSYSVTFYTVQEVIFHGATQVPLLKHARGEPVIRTNCVFWVKCPVNSSRLPHF